MTGHRLFRGLLALALTAGALFPACLSDPEEPEGDNIVAELPGTAIARPTASATPTATVAPTPVAWLIGLLEPGPPAGPPSSIFILNGPDVWLIDAELSVRQVTRQRRVSVVATVPDGERAAAVFLQSIGGREAEEIRLVDADGQESEPVYGPEIVASPAGNPRVSLLAWSPDGARLAVVRDDGSIWIAGPEQDPSELVPAGDSAGVEQLAWSPDGSAIAILTRRAGEGGEVSVIPLAEEGRVDISPERSFGAIAWLPLEARLAVTEDRRDGPNPHAGSLFTIRPDGTERELLISAGEFGPTVGLSQLQPSPDGSWLAFVVDAPDPTGELRFKSLHLLELATGIRRQIPVSPGLGVTDLWWSERGLIWRAVDVRLGASYSGVEPFAIEAADIESGATELIFATDGA